MSELLSKAKDVLDITGAYKDDEISDLLDAALLDLEIAGVNTDLLTDPLIIRAVLTYCLANFKGEEDRDSWKKVYDEQKAQLQMSSRFTNWGEGCGR